jgi:hypothetical protein
MNETAQEGLPKSIEEFRAQVAESNPEKWGKDTDNPVETSDKALLTWMKETMSDFPRKGRIKNLLRRVSSPFRSSDNKHKG